MNNTDLAAHRIADAAVLALAANFRSFNLTSRHTRSLLFAIILIDAKKLVASITQSPIAKAILELDSHDQTHPKDTNHHD